MADIPGPTDGQQPAPSDAQLARTAEELRALAERIGAVPPGKPRVMSLRTARITFVAVVTAAGLASYWLWNHWHSVLLTLAPLIWILESGRRWRKRGRETRADLDPPIESP
jgi:hypothetical protein